MFMLFVVRANVKAAFEYRQSLPTAAMIAFRVLETISFALMVAAISIFAVKVLYL
jgi:hypothetical protein